MNRAANLAARGSRLNQQPAAGLGREPGGAAPGREAYGHVNLFLNAINTCQHAHNDLAAALTTLH
ncbi:hypothetical protein KQ899_15750 [Listeria monocytogenes]|nr:hypothetical protein [Listeria monocytogenes]